MLVAIQILAGGVIFAVALLRVQTRYFRWTLSGPEVARRQFTLKDAALALAIAGWLMVALPFVVHHAKPPPGWQPRVFANWFSAEAWKTARDRRQQRQQDRQRRRARLLEQQRRNPPLSSEYSPGERPIDWDLIGD